jgi:hypothetical protein
MDRWTPTRDEEQTIQSPVLHFQVYPHRMYEESPDSEVHPMLGYEFLAVDAPMTFYTEFKGWAEHL